MISYLQRYLARSILTWIALMMMLLLSIELFFSLIQEAKQLGTGHYGLAEVFSVLILSIPGRVYQMFPLSALVGTLMGLSVLASHSELVAMRAAGLSIVKMLRMVLKIGLLLSVLLSILGEWGAPWCDHMAESIRAYALSGGQAVQTHDGLWLREGEQFVHIHRIIAPDQLEGVTLYQGDAHQHLEEALSAEAALYKPEQGGWILKNVRQTNFKEVKKLILSQHSEMQWRVDLNPTLLKISTIQSLDQLSATQLWHTIQFREKNGLSVAAYELSFWQKLMKPLATLMMMALGIPFVLGPLRQASQGLRLLTGIFLGFVFYTLNASLGPFMLVYHWPAGLGAVLPLLLFGGLAVWLFKRF